jgi:hypothetical protein
MGIVVMCATLLIVWLHDGYMVAMAMHSQLLQMVVMLLVMVMLLMITVMVMVMMEYMYSMSSHCLLLW